MQGRQLLVIVDHAMELSDEIIQQAIEQASLRTKTAVSSLPGKLLITMLDQSPNLFADGCQNGFIGINAAVCAIKNPRIRDIVLKLGLAHEFCHELTGKTGNAFEQALLLADCQYLRQLLKELGISDKDFFDELGKVCDPQKLETAYTNTPPTRGPGGIDLSSLGGSSARVLTTSNPDSKIRGFVGYVLFFQAVTSLEKW